MKTLLRSALWYLNKWGMNPVFTNIYKKPYRNWSEYYMEELTQDTILKDYEEILRSGGKPAGIALVPSKRSRTVMVDLDIYRVEYGAGVEEIAGNFTKDFVVVLTPRGGLRIVFAVPEGSYVPSRFTIRWYDKPVGEGGGTFKHLWTVPPSVACVQKVVDDAEAHNRCDDLRHYYFVLENGKKVRYPWELPTNELPVWSWEDAKNYISTVLQVEISEAVFAGEGEISISSSSEVLRVPIPCWKDLNEFMEWLEDPVPPLPNCVAIALGYRIVDGEMTYTGEKIPHGMRFTYGVVALHFLSSTIVVFDAKELIDFIGRNLEDYPLDSGEPLNVKISRHLVKYGNMVLPRYGGLGSLVAGLPKEVCEACMYKDLCLNNTLGGLRHVPWLPFSTRFWSLKMSKRKFFRSF